MQPLRSVHVVGVDIGAKHCGIILGTFELGMFTVKKAETLELSSFKDFDIYKMIFESFEGCTPIYKTIKISVVPV